MPTVPILLCSTPTPILKHALKDLKSLQILVLSTKNLLGSTDQLSICQIGSFILAIRVDHKYLNSVLAGMLKAQHASIS